MKNVFSTLSLLTLLIFSIGLTSKAYAQSNIMTEELKQAMANRTENEKKLESNIFCDIYKYNKVISEGKSINEALKNFGKSLYVKDEQNRILIVIRLNTTGLADAEVIKQKIENLNGILKGIFSDNRLFTEIYCLMPAEEIIYLVNSENIRSIRPSMRIVTNTITTAGYAQLKALDVKNQFGVTGQGYTIGVISDGVKSVLDVLLQGKRYNLKKIIIG